MRIVYPAQHLWTFTLSLNGILTKLSRNSRKKITIGAFLMKLTAQIVIYVRTVLLAIRQFLCDDQNETLLLLHFNDTQPLPGAKVKDTRKNGGAKKRKRKGERACNYFFKRPVPVYQLLVYPLIGLIWQFISTLSKRVVPVTQKDGLQRPRAWNRGIHDTSVLNECLRDLPHIGALRKEQKTCLVNWARGKNVFAILQTGFGLAW